MSLDAIAYVKTLAPGAIYRPARALMFVIAENTFNDTGECRVGQQVLAAEADLPERTLRRYLGRLEADGVIARRVRAKSGGGRLSDALTLCGFTDWLRKVRPDRAAMAKPANLAGSSKSADSEAANVAGSSPSEPASRWPEQTGQEVAGSIKTPVLDSRTQSLPLPPLADDRTGGEQSSAGLGLSARGWARGWDQAGRSAVFDLIGAPGCGHVAEALLVPLVGTLNPPAGVHAASYVRDLANRLADWPADVLAELAECCRAERVRDLPAVAVLARTAREIAQHRSRGASVRPAATTRNLDTWLAELARADGAAANIALMRRLVGRIGADAALAWFDGMAVSVDGDRVAIAIASKFKAGWVSRNYGDDVQLAAAAEWPGSRARIVAAESVGRAAA